jgi:hypothetical protein
MRHAVTASLALLAACDSRAADCAATIAQLRALVADESFALEWHETTMDDEKPLVLSVLERDGALFLTFVKASEGLWAEGAAVVCRNGARLEAVLPVERLKIGPAAHWAMRYGFSNGAQFALARIGKENLRVETAGWSGVFTSARSPR